MTVLDDLSGFEFEDVMEDVFRNLGYENVRQAERTTDEGRDVLMEEVVDGTRRAIVVECKHTGVVGGPVVQKLHSAIATFDFDGPKRGMVVTTGRFTDPTPGVHRRHRHRSPGVTGRRPPRRRLLISTQTLLSDAGRWDAAKIQHREGIAHGDGQGDLSESSLHVAMVELGRQYIQQAFAEDAESDAVEAVAYHEVDDARLDAAGLDEDGEVVVTLEAERSNNDTLRTVPEDYDKMAALDPEAAIWIVKNRDGAHDVLDALNDPPEGEVRVEKAYSRSSPPQRFQIDEPGLTEMYTFQYQRDSILDGPR